MDEETRIKYRYLLNSLYSINNKLNDVINEFNTLDKQLLETVKINDEQVDKEKIELINDKFNNIKTNLNTILIKKVSEKI